MGVNILNLIKFNVQIDLVVILIYFEYVLVFLIDFNFNIMI
jgi:hypothetical protein